MPNTPIPCKEHDGYAHPEDRIDRMGRTFSALKLDERHGITFGRYVELVEIGEWDRIASLGG